MAGRGMGIATRGGGAVSSGPRNKVVSKPSKKTPKVVRMRGGGAMNQHKEMAMGMMHGGEPMRMRGGGMPMPMPMRGGGMSKKKKVKKFRDGGSCG